MMPSDSHSPALLNVSVTPTLPDFVSFSLRFRFLPPPGLIIYPLILLGAFAYTAYAVQMIAARVPPGPIQYAGTAALLGVPVLALVLLATGTRSAARRLWRASPDLREPREYTFTDEGVQVVGETFATFVAWPNVTTAVRAGEQVLLGTGQQSFLVPLWAFDTDDDRTQFRELVTAKVEGCRL